MAIDTRERRASAIGMARPWRLQIPAPDGAVSTSDRQQVGYRYVGILSGAFVPPALISYIMTVTEVSQPVMEIL